MASFVPRPRLEWIQLFRLRGYPARLAMSETSTTRNPLRRDTHHGARIPPLESVSTMRVGSKLARGDLRRVDPVLAARLRMGRSVALEVLHLSFVLLGGLARFEGAEVPPLPGPRILLPGVESVPAGLQLLDHGSLLSCYPHGNT